MIIKVRGVIRDQEKVFLVREPQKGFYFLPGGTLEDGESLSECLRRELYEELGVRAELGSVLQIREFKNGDRVMLDVWLEVLNSSDYQSLSLESATHAFEFCDPGFYSIEDLKGKDIQPQSLWSLLDEKENLPVVIRLGERGIFGRQ